MEGKWLIPNWVFEVWQSFLLPSSQKCTNGDSIKYPRSHFQSYNHGSNPRITDAWNAALRAATLIVPWGDTSEAYRRKPAFRKDYEQQIRNINRSCMSGLMGAYGILQAPLTLAYTHSLSLILRHLFTETSTLCLPAVVALSGAVMPPLEDLPSKMLPSHIEKVEEEDLDKEAFAGQEAALCVANPLQTTMNSFEVDESFERVVVEPKTGFEFPSHLCSDSNPCHSMKKVQVLAGVGLRSLSLVKLKSIKIYAFGLYIEPHSFKAIFGGRYGAVPTSILKQDSSFFEELLRHDLGMTVRLVVHYKALKTGMVRSAFDSSLRNRLKKIKGIDDDGGLEVFNSYFSESLMLPRGTIIDFRWLPGGKFQTEIDGKLLGTIHSRDFCRAFFDIYIGNPPVSMKAKEEIGEKLGQILHSS